MSRVGASEVNLLSDIYVTNYTSIMILECILTCNYIHTFFLPRQVKNQNESRGQQSNSEDILKGPEGKLSPLQALFSPPGLQQMQQFLQQVANNNGGSGGTPTGTGGPGFNPAQLHHFMQQQQTFLNHHQVKKPRIITLAQKPTFYPEIIKKN